MPPPSEWTLPIQFETDLTEGDYEKCTQNFDKDGRDIKKSLLFTQEYSGTNVFAVAIHKEHDRNRIMEIPAGSGDALNYEVYNNVRDVHQIWATDFLELGHVPVNYTMTVEDSNWEVNIPLPFSVIKRYLTPQQKRRYNGWLSSYDKENYEIKFIQTVGAY